jgi:hypothetical protein
MREVTECSLLAFAPETGQASSLFNSHYRAMLFLSEYTDSTSYPAWASPNMTQITVVALYGEKRGDFAALVTRCQRLVRSVLGVGFQPYDPSQIHATIFGLERKMPSAFGNANFSRYRGRDLVMNLEGILDYLRRCSHFPLQVQVGGFGKRDYPFVSRQACPYERSFSIQGDKVVMMGWPIRGKPFPRPPGTPSALVQEAKLYPLTLDVIRHAAQAYGVLHAYHRGLTDLDNDLFFRIGLVIDPPSLSEQVRATLEAEARQFLSVQPPLILDIHLEQVSVALYREDTLPRSTTRMWSLADPDLTASALMEHLE